MIIKNSKVYDILKAVAQIWLPALGTLYFALAGVWGLPSADEVVATVLAVDTFLGIVLGISSANYSSENVGNIISSETALGKTKIYTLELDGNPETIDSLDEVRFTVVRKKTSNSINEDGLSLVEALIVILIVVVILSLAFGR